ncbi:hypothetical protein DB30_03258 [Enhygromyxa salina]|uniref:Uncharacterized protein n=1 Tax=Enhygromyxa salina TaxID=215803 RepID=A0A0C2DCV5_9BACT|nr:hypothetical protein [Enhygromyxa salina]KIG17557.1 hypothetical protein DB30_03258 [Enhygromyxa salina]
MPAKYNAEPQHASRVEALLHSRGVEHVRARKHGATVVVESGPEDDPVKYFRLRRDGVHLWCLDMNVRGGRWERTPFRDNIDVLVATVVENFPWVLADIA